jgi:MFS family permease
MAEADSPASIAPSRALPLIMVVSGLFGAQRGMLGPLIPLYIISLGHGFAWLGVIVAAQGAFQVLLRFFGGIFADRFGEQTVLRVGFFIMVLGSMIFIFLSAIWALIVAQLFIGASRAVHNSAAQSYASRITEGNRAKVMGRFRGSESLGSAIGPPFAAVAILISGGLAAGFVLVAIGNALALAMALVLPRIPRQQSRSVQEIVTAIPSLFRSRPLLLAGIFAFWAAMAPSIYAVVAVPFFQESGMSDATNSGVTTVSSIGAAVGGFAFGWVASRMSQPLIAVVGMFTFGLALFAMAATGTMPLVVLVLLLWGVTNSLVNNLRTVIAAEHSPAANRGTAVAYVGTWWAMSQFIGPVALGLIVAAVGLQQTLVVLGVVSVPLALLSPLLFRLLLPKLATELVPEASA